MLTEWIAREGWIIFNWWLLATLAGAAIFPLCTRFLRGLPDRGYTFARPAGMLIVAFVFWLLGCFGFLQNTAGGMVLSWLIVLVISLIGYFAGRDTDEPMDWRGWWKENWTLILSAELVFAAALIGWCIVRTYQNGILYTEKDMELAFISSVMRSSSYPPNDPWLAGYAISYYYFGYVIAGMMSVLSGVNSTTGFNMTTAMTFALTALGAFGVVYNLVRSRAFRFKIAYPAEAKPERKIAIGTGLLGVLILLLMGNWQALLIEIPWETGTASPAYLQFFGSDQRNEPNPYPTQSIDQWAQGGWWWFRSARVLNDLNIRIDPEGNVINNPDDRSEVIDEFPAFSFLLADNHPHVLSLPYTLLAIGLALNTLLSTKAPRRAQILFYSVCLGGLIFLNTWDGPIYMVLLIAAEALRRFIRGGGVPLKMRDYLHLLGLGVSIVALSVVLYLPFLVGFRSQLGGILPNVQYPTLFSQFLAHFGPLLVIVAIFLIAEAWRAERRFNAKYALIAAATAFIGLFLLLILLVALAAFIPSLQSAVLAFVDENGGWGTVIPAVIQKRAALILTSLVLVGGLFLVVGRLFPRVFSTAQEVELKPKREGDTDAESSVVSYPPATGFVLLLIGAGIALTLIPEFVYLRDNFSTRMNTIFKFYYQAWTMWSIASAYALYTLLADHEIKLPAWSARFAISSAAALAITGGLLFTVIGVYSRTVVETGRNSFPEDDPALTLDGAGAFIRSGVISQDDYTAVQCLGQLVTGSDVTVVQAPGGSYGWGYGSVGTLTGIPVLFNWGGHESQWRGTSYGQAVGTREADIARLYSDPYWETASAILSQYGIDYVFFGTRERSQYHTDDLKFRDNLEIVCESGDTRVYRVPEQEVAQR
ncbi:MAG: DUF2298 domain-containing protein [Anaerolineae bacterium]